MSLLAFDTTTGACSAALFDESSGKILNSEFQIMQRGHAEALAPMVAQVMQSAGCKMQSLTRLGVTTGPGTFTGVRIGMAFARALAVALGIPLSGISTLRAIAANADAKFPVAAVMDARRGEVYLQIFEPGGRARTRPQVLSVADAAVLLPDEKIWLAGSGAELVAFQGGEKADLWKRPDISFFPDARNVACLVFEKAKKDENGDKPRPLYLRKPDAKLPQKPGISLLATS